MAADTRPCRCGHPRAQHEHLRPGDDCGPCGKAVCARYRPDPGFWAGLAAGIRQHLTHARARRLP